MEDHGGCSKSRRSATQTSGDLDYKKSNSVPQKARLTRSDSQKIRARSARREEQKSQKHGLWRILDRTLERYCRQYYYWLVSLYRNFSIFNFSFFLGQGSLIPLTSDNVSSLSSYIHDQQMKSINANQNLLNQFQNEYDLNQSMESFSLRNN